MDPRDALTPSPIESSPVERRLEGSRVSSGIGAGRAWLIGDILECRGPAHAVKAGDVAAEMRRIREAFAQVAQDLDESARRVAEQLDPGLAEIFLAHRAVLDSLFTSGELEVE